LLDQGIARRFFASVLAEAKKRHLLSSDRFTVEGALLQARTLPTSCAPKETETDEPVTPGERGKNVAVDFHRERRSDARVLN
jgi:hypothetical protein